MQILKDVQHSENCCRCIPAVQMYVWLGSEASKGAVIPRRCLKLSECLQGHSHLWL